MEYAPDVSFQEFIFIIYFRVQNNKEHVQAIEIDTQTDFKLLIPSQIKREISIETKNY